MSCLLCSDISQIDNVEYDLLRDHGVELNYCPVCGTDLRPYMLCKKLIEKSEEDIRTRLDKRFDNRVNDLFGDTKTVRSPRTKSKASEIKPLTMAINLGEVDITDRDIDILNKTKKETN